MTFYMLRPRTLRMNRVNWNNLYKNTIAHEGISFPMDIRDDENAYILQAVLPGVKSEDIDIEIASDAVTIKGEFQKEDQENVKYLLQERASGYFSRVISLPDEIDADNTEAKLEDGILTLHIPKVAEALPRKIKVNAN
jgi:HSP20 family protein